MKKRLTRVAPLRTGIVLSILYGIGGLIVAPFFLLATFAGKGGAVGGIAIAVMLPFIYAVAGFIGGIIASALYNLIAKWTGGLEFELTDETPGA